MSKILKTFLKSILLIIIGLFISSIIINILYYFDIVGNNVVKYLKMFLSITIFFISGFYIGRNSVSKGYINGIKLSIIMVILFIILGFIFNNIKVLRIVYYLIMTTCITFGAMIGISKNEG